MAEQISSPGYWQSRLHDAIHRGCLHLAVFRCPLERWERIEAKHRQILAATIRDNDSVLDAGCGYGRLLTLMPPTWEGRYLGVDISPDFIAMAKREWPGRAFILGDLAQLPVCATYDWAVLISIRPMVKRELGGEAWERMEKELRRVASKIIYLEYDENDEGAIE